MVSNNTTMAGQGGWKEGALCASQSLYPLMEKNKPIRMKSSPQGSALADYLRGNTARNSKVSSSNV